MKSRAAERARRETATDRVVRWAPAALLVLATVALVSVWNTSPPRRGGAGIQGGIAWLPVGHGEVEFLGEAVEFQATRRSGEELYRVELPDRTAFESGRLDALIRIFALHKMDGLQLGEPVTFRFWLAAGLGGRPGITVPSSPLRWEVVFLEVTKEEEIWYRSNHGTTGEALYARSLETIKSKVAQELARDIVALRAGELAPP